MQSDPAQIHTTPSTSTSTRKTRPPRPTKPSAHPGTDAAPRKTASPAAIDEVFAMLARNVERMRQSHARVSGAKHAMPADEPIAATTTTGTPTGVGTIPSSPIRPSRSTIDPATIRHLDAEMDRQHERLAHLLRDIDATTAAD